MTESAETVYITTIAGKSALVRVKLAMDGGMVEFTDAVSGVLRGSAGIRWWEDETHSVIYDGPLPTLPQEERWC